MFKTIVLNEMQDFPSIFWKNKHDFILNSLHYILKVKVTKYIISILCLENDCFRFSLEFIIIII